MANHTGVRIGILTSGGDAPGMNAVVRAVARTGISLGADVYAVFEGYQGLIDGGDSIRRFGWDDVSGILHQGGTAVGTFRCPEFKTREGMLSAAENLIHLGIDRLVVIGGDGSLSGLDAFRAQWASLLDELVTAGRIGHSERAAHPSLKFAGVVASIDNDMVGTDMTVGADSALHRILDAIDSLTSTAASHQRSFVIEVMGRHCGYLALMSAVAGGCDYVFIPEDPPAPGWEQRMCEALQSGRSSGRRDSLVIVAEGVRDRQGNPITSGQVRQVIEDTLGEDTRVTILGHVQRGGRPSAFDRWCSTVLGYEAAREVILNEDPSGCFIGYRGNRVVRVQLEDAVNRTRQVPKLIDSGDSAAAMGARGGSFNEMARIFAELSEPSRSKADGHGKRIAVVHAGGLGPGMNPAARAAVRLGINRGFTMLGIQGGFPGLRDGNLRGLCWEDVEGWVFEGGANLGIRRSMPKVEELYSIGRQLESHSVDALLVIGGWNAYQSANLLFQERDRYPAFNIPIVCVPASIDNNLPGSELSIGADTALNIAVEVVDRVKQSAAASTRCFVIETMGRYCGYLALMTGLAGGSELVYLHEEGITLAGLNDDVNWMRNRFASGRKLVVAIRNELANEHYTTDFLARMFEEEGAGLFDVRQAVIGHQLQGGVPSPFDRLLATRLVSHALDLIGDELTAGNAEGHYVGLVESRLSARPIDGMLREMDREYRRPKNQWWLGLRDVVGAVSVEPGETTHQG